VFTMSGGTNSAGPIALGGLIGNSDGSGNFTGGLEDYNDAGVLSPTQLAFGGTAVGGGSVGGRVLVNANGSFFPATQLVIYPSSGGLLLMETDGANNTQGIAFSQTATSFTTGTSTGYGLSLVGENISNFVTDSGQFNATTAVSPAVNVIGVLDENDQGVTVPPVNMSGTYSPDSPATGRGSISVTTNGTFLGGLSLEYYVVNSSTALVIEGDTNQVTAGVFQLQSTPTQGGLAHSSLTTVHLKPSARGAFKQHRQ